VTREDIIKNDFIKNSVGVTPIVDKMRKNRLRWFVHVKKRGDLETV